MSSRITKGLTTFLWRCQLFRCFLVFLPARRNKPHTERTRDQLRDEAAPCVLRCHPRQESHLNSDWSISITRHRSGDAIGPSLQLQRVVVTPALSLARETQDSVGPIRAVQPGIGRPDGRCDPRPASPHKYFTVIGTKQRLYAEAPECCHRDSPNTGERLRVGQTLVSVHAGDPGGNRTDMSEILIFSQKDPDLVVAVTTALPWDKVS